MDEAKIKEILGNEVGIDEDGYMYSVFPYISYYPRAGEVTLDGDYTPEQLEAIAAHMRAHGGK